VPRELRHCLLGGEHYSGPEMTPEKYRRVARTIPPFYFLLLTGGEPFIRVDLPDIADVFVKNCGVRNIGIPTNGAFPAETARAVRHMARMLPDVQFGIDVSIDAPGAAHDEVRCLPGLFDSAVDTYRRLTAIAKRKQNLNVSVAVTVSRNNIDKLDELAEFLFRDLDATNVNIMVVRGNPRDPKSLHVDPEAYRRFVERVERETANRGGGYRGYPEAGYVNAMRGIRSRVIYDTLRTGKYQVPCYAARLGVVLRANGDVKSCELRKATLGNVYEALYNFKKNMEGPHRKSRTRGHPLGTLLLHIRMFPHAQRHVQPEVHPEIVRVRREGREADADSPEARRGAD